MMHKFISSAFVFGLLFSFFPLPGQLQPVKSGVYNWEKLPVEKSENKEKRSIIKGSTVDLESLEIDGWTIAQNAVFEEAPKKDFEQLVIVKEGKIIFSLGKESKELVPGSMSLILPGDTFTIENKNGVPASFYLMTYSSRKKANPERGKAAGGSFIKDWEEITYTPHDKGGVRKYFNRPTTMCNYAEMHVTTLNGEIKSHEPHTHRAAEIVLMVDGNTEMEIGDGLYQGTVGDIYFLGSNVSHAIRNIEKDPCIYFAFQWE